MGRIGTSHTPAICLCKPRSILEGGKKQPIVWLQYVCGMTEMFLDEPSGKAEHLYPSFGVGFKPTFLTLGRANAFVMHSLNRKVPLVLLWSPYGGPNYTHYIHGDVTKVSRRSDGGGHLKHHR